MIEGKTWDIIKGPKAIASCPKWNDKCVMRPRFHSCHYCFNNCNNAESHIPEDQIPQDMKKIYKKWHAKIRKDRK